MRKLSEWSDNELSNLFKNATDIITKNKPQKSEAIKKIEEVKKEWATRKQQYLDGKRRVGFPEKGMLSTLGYQAGYMTFPEREYILKFLMENEDLPFVQSPAYMATWGTPLSEKRLIKLSYLLRNLINKKKKDGEFYHREETRNNWKDDLDFIYKTYYIDKFNFKWPL